MSKKYQALVDEYIYFGGADDVENMIINEHCEVIVDLRAEVTKSTFDSAKLHIQTITIPLDDQAETIQTEILQEAIDQIVYFYHQGKKVGFHCGGGRGRTGTVAIGVLVALGKARTIEEAECLAKEIRPIISIKEKQRKTLELLFPSNR